MAAPVSLAAREVEQAPRPRRTPRRDRAAVVPGPRTVTRRPRRPRVVRAPGSPVPLGTVVGAAALVVALLLGLFGAYVLLFSGLAAGRAQDVRYAALDEQLGLATAPVTNVVPDGTSLGIVEVPRLGLEQVFVAGAASEETIDGPGLRHDSVLPGQAGTSVLVGRRAGFGGAFADLDQLRAGDAITVTTGQGVFSYVVDLVRRSDDPAAEIEQVASRLTLVTSDPALTPSRQLVVTAQLDGDALPRSSGGATVADDAPGVGSSGRYVPLLLWSQLLLLVTGLVTWAAVRLPQRGALWIGAVPVLLAVLWNVFENLAVLLPNTL